MPTSRWPSKPQTHGHRWPKYSLRTLLISLTLLGMWLGAHMHKVRQQDRAVAAIRSAGGQVIYEDSGPIADPRLSCFMYLEAGYDQTRRPAPAWLEDRIGRDFTSRVVGISFRVDERHNLRYARNFDGPFGPKINPSYPDPKPEHMVHLGPELLRQIGSLKSVTSLYLAETDVDDAGAEHLKSLPRLKYVALGNCVSEEGFGKLQDAMPNVFIEY